MFFISAWEWYGKLYKTKDYGSIRLKMGVLPHIFNCQRPNSVKPESRERFYCVKEIVVL